MTGHKHDFLSLMKQRVVIFDGGMGSMLISAGLGQRDVPEGWVLSKPEEIAKVHHAYLDAGAEVITTCTFGGSPIKLASSEAGRKLDVAKINEKAVEIARTTIEHSGKHDRYVAGDIGPTGQFFAPVGTLEPAKARAAFRTQAQALERAGVDLFIIETIYDIREAVEALRAVREVSSRPAVVTLTFEKRPRGYFTMMGDTTEKAVEILPKEGASALGANCTLQGADMVELVEEFRLVAPDALLLFQPNAGQPVMEHGMPVYKQRPKEFAADVKRLVEAGASAVGGCCGTTPEFIREVHELIVHGK